MKNSHCCSKCGSTDILRIPGQSGAYGTGNNIPAGFSVFSAVLVTRYVCGNCGFSEEWLEDREGIEKLRKKHQAGF